MTAYDDAPDVATALRALNADRTSVLTADELVRRVDDAVVVPFDGVRRRPAAWRAAAAGVAAAATLAVAGFAWSATDRVTVEVGPAGGSGADLRSPLAAWDFESIDAQRGATSSGAVATRLRLGDAEVEAGPTGNGVRFDGAHPSHAFTDVPVVDTTQSFTVAIRVKLDPVPDCLIQALVAQDAEVRIHIDDFGAGFTGLQSVRSIPAHAVKIDRSLVRSLHDDPASVAVVRSVVGLASDLGMDVIAEGVESEADEHALLRLGVRRFQGYHVGRPGPEETLVVHGVHPASQTVVVMPAPRLQDEVGRLAELHRTGIMDSGRDDRFDTLVSLAAEVCDTPAAILTFVDEDRQWFKASVGVTRSESPRDWSFAAHGLAADGLFTVCDTHADARFASSPLVVGEPFVRSYAGAPLRTSTGHVLGMLCVIDRRPRSLTPHQQRMLQALADQAIALLELRVLSSARPASGGRRSATARHCVIACA